MCICKFPKFWKNGLISDSFLKVSRILLHLATLPTILTQFIEQNHLHWRDCGLFAVLKKDQQIVEKLRLKIHLIEEFNIHKNEVYLIIDLLIYGYDHYSVVYWLILNRSFILYIFILKSIINIKKLELRFKIFKYYYFVTFKNKTKINVNTT